MANEFSVINKGIWFRVENNLGADAGARVEGRSARMGFVPPLHLRPVARSEIISIHKNCG
jgi:hypothetical protein